MKTGNGERMNLHMDQLMELGYIQWSALSPKFSADLVTRKVFKDMMQRYEVLLKSITLRDEITSKHKTFFQELDFLFFVKMDTNCG